MNIVRTKEAYAQKKNVSGDMCARMNRKTLKRFRHVEGIEKEWLTKR